MREDTGGEFDEKTLAYDLRQRYAKLVGDHLEIVAFFRRDRNYPEYFRALEDLQTIIAHKFKGKERQEDREKYNNLRTKAINVSNKYQDAWFGNSQNNNEVAEIENSLRDIERFLYEMMDDASMFGVAFDDEGL